jgi:hypothetical protein
MTRSSNPSSWVTWMMSQMSSQSCTIRSLSGETLRPKEPS